MNSGICSLDDSRLDGLVVDGQQRLYAIQRYIDNECAFPAVDGTLMYWDDLTAPERRRFGKTMFPYIETRIDDETELKRLYDLHNFGGTPHLAHQRALRCN